MSQYKGNFQLLLIQSGYPVAQSNYIFRLFSHLLISSFGVPLFASQCTC